MTIPIGNRIVTPADLATWFGGETSWWEERIECLQSAELIVDIDGVWIGDPIEIQKRLADRDVWATGGKKGTSTRYMWASARRHAKEFAQMVRKPDGSKYTSAELMSLIGVTKIVLIASKPDSLRRELLDIALPPTGASTKQLEEHARTWEASHSNEERSSEHLLRGLQNF